MISKRFCKNAKREMFNTPKFYCETCKYRDGSRCIIFKRHIVNDYNKCLNHSIDNFSSDIKFFERTRKSA